MNLPPLDAAADASRYCGLYVFDFGEWTAVGYSADEVAMLLESEQYRDGKAYRIVRVSPHGRWELQGVPTERFHFESGVFFYREALDAAEADYEVLREMASRAAPPCRCFIQLSELPTGLDEHTGDTDERLRYVTALIYPAEFDPEMSRWLLRADFNGGDSVEGGVSMVTRYRDARPNVMRREQFWSETSGPRTAEEVFATVRKAFQR
jgi:hypothetical protein